MLGYGRPTGEKNRTPPLPFSAPLFLLSCAHSSSSCARSSSTHAPLLPLPSGRAAPHKAGSELHLPPPAPPPPPAAIAGFPRPYCSSSSSTSSPPLQRRVPHVPPGHGRNGAHAAVAAAEAGEPSANSGTRGRLRELPGSKLPQLPRAEECRGRR